VTGQQASIRADLASLEASSDKIRSTCPPRSATPSASPSGRACSVSAAWSSPAIPSTSSSLTWTPGYKLGLRAGDTVRSAGGREFTPKDSLEDLKMIIQENLGKTLQVIVDRDGKSKTLPLKIPKAISGEYLYSR